jgi:AcrR family transcriptional regulator
MAAAERCAERYGIEKTTMEDVAKEARVSRPSVYRYFSDRDELILAVLIERSQILIGKMQRFIAKQPTFADALVEGLLFIGHHASRDPFVSRLYTSDRSVFASRLLGRTDALAELTGEFWDVVVADAQSRGEASLALDRDLTRQWLVLVDLVVATQLAAHPDDVDQLRTILRAFVLPAFLPPVAGTPRRRREANVLPASRPSAAETTARASPAPRR